ncbi:peptidylprolyl isomerase [Candidatus Woesearchaeota archaeon]|nr:peptidylprolyl isomerase [Candidatus Woesearchaeota archaeon]
MAIKKGDFIELDYTGKVKDGNIFDTTLDSVAKEHGLNPKAQYKPIIICVGEQQLLRGLDEYLEGKAMGKHTIEIAPEQGFGKKDTKLLTLIPASKFKNSKIRPVVGLEVNIDDHYGIIRSISGGRITVDFNHPLAGRDLTYEVEVKGLVTDPAKQVAALLDMASVHHHGVKMEGAKHAVVDMHEVPPPQFADAINKMVTRLTKVEDISYQAGKHDH